MANSLNVRTPALSINEIIRCSVALLQGYPLVLITAGSGVK
jgi:hypothetical protein